MELAIPLVALGGMYVISNQKNKKCENPKEYKKVQNSQQQINQGKENFTNMGQFSNYLPNTNIPPQNYPVTNQKELVDTVQEYPNPNVSTDKYFNQNLYQSKSLQQQHISNNIQNVYSLSGNYINSTEFKHNNMVPFFGAKLKSGLYKTNMSENILDNYSGAGSQTIKKVEQAPLFAPETNISWAYGTPNSSDFYQSRVTPGTLMNNVKPFVSENVGPGLNHGYTTSGSGGFNSGMESRDSWLPKTVDELRVDTNPKQSYSLSNLEGPSYSHVQNLGILGKVEKNRPDTFYISGQDRLFTTTGIEKGQRLVADEDLKKVHRDDTSSSYIGGPKAVLTKTSYVDHNYEETKRMQLPAFDVKSSSAIGRGPIDDKENNHKNHFITNNNRTMNIHPLPFGSGFSNAIGAVIAPLLDVLKPSKKDDISANVRIYGDAGASTPANYVLYPTSTVAPTIKEMSIHSTEGFVGNQKNAGYQNKDYLPVENQRDTTNYSRYGTVGGSTSNNASRNYDAEYNQINNDLKEPSLKGRINHGSNQIFNQYTNISISKNDEDRNNNRLSVQLGGISLPPSTETLGVVNQQYGEPETDLGHRISPDLLKAFRENPYTHSLTYAV